MGNSGSGDALGRRELLLGTGAAALIALVTSADRILAQSAEPSPSGASNGWETTLKNLTGDQVPAEGKLVFDLAEIVENGNTVPFTVSIDSPMTESAYVKAIHIISTGNPLPAVVTFRFTPESGKAAVASRMRLAQTQDVIGLAELSDGQLAMAKRSVKVTIGGCGGG